MNELNDNNNKITQPSGLLITLMQHQKTAVYAMLELEKNGYVDAKFCYFDNATKDLRLCTTLGILGDKVGSGKTITLLALLLTQYQPECRDIYCDVEKFFQIKEKFVKPELFNNVNLIVVSKTIQHQWEACIKTNINSNCINFASVSNLDNKLDETKFTKDKMNLILCNDKTLEGILCKFRYNIWNRLIIDDADTLNIDIDKIKANFVWLVTGTTNGIELCKKKYIKQIFPSKIMWISKFLTIKNSEKYIEESINLPSLEKKIIKCDMPYELKLIANHIPLRVVNMINAGNIDQAVKVLNCHTDTLDNIVKVVENNYKLALNNKMIELTAEKKKIYINHNASTEHNKKLDIIEKTINRLQGKLDALHESVLNMNDEVCPICMNNFTTPTLVDCCARMFCFECISLTLRKNEEMQREPRCPLCQKCLNLSQIHVVNVNHSITNNGGKLENLLKLISAKPDGKFLVFSEYRDTFEKITNLLTAANTAFEILSTNNKVAKQLENFSKGTTKIIMLNAQHFGAGLNIQSATDIVIFHRLKTETEEQVIGRGQRIGRTNKLTVHYLMYENETYSEDADKNENFQDYLENYPA